MLVQYLERQPKNIVCKRDDMRNSAKRLSTPHLTKRSQPKGRESETRVPRKDVTYIVCNRCNGFGHMKAECPNKRDFTVSEWKDIRAKSTKRIMSVDTEDGNEGLFEEDDGGNLKPYVEEPVHEGSSQDEILCDEPLPPEIQHVMVVPKEVVAQPQLVRTTTSELLPLRAGEDIGSFEQGTESLQGEESEGIQVAPKDDLVRPTIRKFEVFETLFDPPKFIPEFMKQSVVADVEATKCVQRDDEAVFIEGVCEEDRDIAVLFFNNKVPFHLLRTYAFGSLAVFESDLNKIRGRIFLKKGRMHQAWVQVGLFMLDELVFGSSSSSLGLV